MDFPSTYTGYWDAEIEGSYEWEPSMDLDPPTETAELGVTFPTVVVAWSFTHIEVIRDLVATVPGEDDEVFQRRKNALHEVAHHFRLADDSGAILSTTNEPNFFNCQIRVIRRCVDFPHGLPIIPKTQTCNPSPCL